MLDAFAGHKVVIRTLDAGSDKPLKFVGHPDEANPALGVRGIRIADGNPGILRGSWRASPRRRSDTGSAPWVMAPMIATPAEAEAFAAQTRSYGLTPGVMIEVPAAALLADRILEHVDFLSIGTNDLTQYTMAADRMSAELATLTDPWQPAVLALVAMAARAGVAAASPSASAVRPPPTRCWRACWSVSASRRCRRPPRRWPASARSSRRSRWRSARTRPTAALATATAAEARAAASAGRSSLSRGGGNNRTAVRL